jgi:large subunit ribosomal protein L25
MVLTLNIEKRDKKEDLEKLRAEGFIPAVYYGPKEESTPIKIKSGDFIKIWNEAGESTIVNLKNEEKDQEALIHDVSIEAVKGNIIHVDFYVVEKGKKVTVGVPLEFVGVSPAEKQGGVLVKVMHEIEITAEPKNLPHEIEVPLEMLTEIGSQIHAKDLKLPTGVEIDCEPEEIIALIQVAKEQVEEAPVEFDPSKVEVAGEKKESEEEVKE